MSGQAGSTARIQVYRIADSSSLDVICKRQTFSLLLLTITEPTCRHSSHWLFSAPVLAFSFLLRSFQLIKGTEPPRGPPVILSVEIQGYFLVISPGITLPRRRP